MCVYFQFGAAFCGEVGGEGGLLSHSDPKRDPTSICLAFFHCCKTNRDAQGSKIVLTTFKSIKATQFKQIVWLRLPSDPAHD